MRSFKTIGLFLAIIFFASYGNTQHTNPNVPNVRQFNPNLAKDTVLILEQTVSLTREMFLIESMIKEASDKGDTQRAAVFMKRRLQILSEFERLRTQIQDLRSRYYIQ